MAFAIEQGDFVAAHWTTADKRSLLATREEGVRLTVPVGTPLVHYLRVRQSRGRVDLVETTVMAFGAAERQASMGRAEERIAIVPAPAWVAAHLGVATSSPVLKLDRMVRTPSGAPLAWRVAYGLAGVGPGTSRPRRGAVRAQPLIAAAQPPAD